MVSGGWKGFGNNNNKKHPIYFQMENTGAGAAAATGPSLSSVTNDDSNASGGNAKDDLSKPSSEWSYYEDIFHDGDDDIINSDSDFEYDDSYSRSHFFTV
jgi:hypothetical protein